MRTRERSRKVLLGASLAILMTSLAGATACANKDGTLTWPTIPEPTEMLVQQGGGKSSKPVAFKPKPASHKAAMAAHDLLRLDDVEKLSGFINLTYIPRDSGVGATGDVNVSRPNGGMLVMMNVIDRAQFEQSKASAYFDEPVRGIGDDAYIGPSRQSSSHRYIVAARRKNRAFIITTFFDPYGRGGPPLLSLDDLEKLARLAAKRL